MFLKWIRFFIFLMIASGFSCAPAKQVNKNYEIGAPQKGIKPFCQEPLKPESLKKETKKKRGVRATPKKTNKKAVKNKELPPLIVIDPGHGGEDFGTSSHSKPKVHEKAFNLATAQFLQRYLKEMGFRTLMTRETDVTVSLNERASFANEKKAFFFVSVHYNSAPSKKAEGVEVFFYDDKENEKRKLKSKALADLVFKNVIEATTAKVRGVKPGNFLVIRETKMPAILVEGGFLTHEEEVKKIRDPLYQKKIALGIAKGIAEYYKACTK